MCNIKKHEPYLDINSDLLDLNLEDSDSVIASTITDSLLLSNEQFFEICSQINEGQQHQYKFIMQYALHCKLAEEK